MKTKNRKGQMKIQQMAFMLIAVTVFFALVGMFVLTIVFSNMKASAAVLEEKNALLLASRLANSPEFRCGNAFGTERANCVDFDKVMALKKGIKKYSQAGFWGVSKIEIIKIYPTGASSNVLCTLENYPECGRIEILPAGEGTGVSNFIVLCRKEYNGGQVQNVCELAKIVITYKG
ncbi:MAG: hypothetical protein AABX76_01285 [Nanoarchaeota archaeon]